MSEPVSTTRRERHAAERRRLILENAARLFAEKGFHRTTTRDIAEAADVSEGTLYNYFVSKDEILLGIMGMLFEQSGLPDQLSGSVLVDPQAFLLTILRLRREQIEDTNDMLQAVLSEILVNPPLRERYYLDLIAPYIRLIEYHLNERHLRGQIRPLDPALLSRLLVGLVSGLYLLQVMGDPIVKDNWEALSRLIVDVLVQGCAAGEAPSTSQGEDT